MSSEIQPIEPDSVRIGIKDGVVQFEFGQIEHIDGQEDDFVILSSIRLNPKYLKSFMLKVLETGIEYEKNFRTDIGFTAFWKKDGN